MPYIIMTFIGILLMIAGAFQISMAGGMIVTGLFVFFVFGVGFVLTH